MNDDAELGDASQDQSSMINITIDPTQPRYLPAVPHYYLNQNKRILDGSYLHQPERDPKRSKPGGLPSNVSNEKPQQSNVANNPPKGNVGITIRPPTMDQIASILSARNINSTNYKNVSQLLRSQSWYTQFSSYIERFKDSYPEMYNRMKASVDQIRNPSGYRPLSQEDDSKSVNMNNYEDQSVTELNADSEYKSEFEPESSRSYEGDLFDVPELNDNVNPGIMEREIVSGAVDSAIDDTIDESIAASIDVAVDTAVGDAASSLIDGVGIALVGVQSIALLNHVQINGEPMFQRGGEYFTEISNREASKGDYVGAGALKAASSLSYGANWVANKYENFEATGGVFGNTERGLDNIENNMKKNGASATSIGVIEGLKKGVEGAQYVSDKVDQAVAAKLTPMTNELKAGAQSAAKGDVRSAIVGGLATVEAGVVSALNPIVGPVGDSVTSAVVGGFKKAASWFVHLF